MTPRVRLHLKHLAPAASESLKRHREEKQKRQLASCPEKSSATLGTEIFCGYQFPILDKYKTNREKFMCDDSLAI